MPPFTRTFPAHLSSDNRFILTSADLDCTIAPLAEQIATVAEDSQLPTEVPSVQATSDTNANATPVPIEADSSTGFTAAQAAPAVAPIQPTSVPPTPVPPTQIPPTTIPPTPEPTRDEDNSGQGSGGGHGTND